MIDGAAVYDSSPGKIANYTALYLVGQRRDGAAVPPDIAMLEARDAAYLRSILRMPSNGERENIENVTALLIECFCGERHRWDEPEDIPERDTSCGCGRALIRYRSVRAVYVVPWQGGLI